MINKYLKLLLADNKRVIIPNFGGFVVKRSAAGDIISFNSFLKFNDDLLANLIVEEEGVDKTQALAKIEELVKDINASLEESGKCEFEGVGFLIKDKKGNIRFVEAVNNEVAPVLPVPEDNTSDDAPQTAEEPVSVSDSPIEEEVVADIPPIEKEKVVVVEKKNNVTLWLILVLIFLAFGAWGIYQNVFNSNKSTTNIETVDSDASHGGVVGQLSEKRNKMLEKQADNQMNITVTPEKKGFIERIIDFFKNLFAKKSTSAPAVEEVEIPVSNIDYAMQPNQVDTISGILVVADKLISPKGKERYNVVIGSFAESENALVFNKELIANEYASEIFDRYNGFSAVSIGAYPSIDIALRMCGEQLKQTPDVWVLVK